MTRLLAAAGVAMVATAAVPAHAETMVSAQDPAGIARALKDAGRKAEVDKDSYGDPLIRTEFGGYTGSIYFYGCDSEKHDKCQSVQFRTGLDRKKPMPGNLLNDIVKKYRYTAMWLDDEGDPWVNFDVVTGAGIPQSVFMSAYNSYSDTMSDVSNMVFADERK